MTRAFLILLAFVLAGCATDAPQNRGAIVAYSSYDFDIAADEFEADLDRDPDINTLLDQLRLGMSALANGDRLRAERALGDAFELLSTAGLNADKTTEAVLVHEGVRIWKGEPFEQALAYYHIGVLYAALGDWENARAALANAIFRLTDFGADQDAETLARSAAEDDDFLDEGYTAVDTNFALGLLLLALATDLSGAGDGAAPYDAVVEIDEDQAPLVARLRARAFDTLLIVDYGTGPQKRRYGPDGALVRFDPQERDPGALFVYADGELMAEVEPICDVADMARDHRWNNLEDVRLAKSQIGDALVVGGSLVGATAHHRSSSSDETTQALIGLGMMVGGLLLKSGAPADVRFLELNPSHVHVVPLQLETPADIWISYDDGPSMLLPYIEPGTSTAPRTLYVRLHGASAREPDWLTSGELLYGNDHDGVLEGDWPWILGGNDVSTPSRAALDAYHASGRLLDMTVEDLRDLYRAEGISFAEPGRVAPPGRHILDGGDALWTPLRDSMGFKRLMYQPHTPYAPISERVRNLAAELRVTMEHQGDPE